ncbi:MAG: hypothetical protein IJE22_08650 [Oscillibacter sp.]|nr:hypothetical protein [Oscillibacter sp.]
MAYMHIFSADVAAKHGLRQAIILQQLVQENEQRRPQLPHYKGHDFMEDKEHDFIWFRYDDKSLQEIFPYWELENIKGGLDELERLGAIVLWRGEITDYLWIRMR